MKAITVTAAQNSNVPERQAQLEQLGTRFGSRWGVPPPTTTELLEADPRRRLSDALMSGGWGVVCIFPWTTNAKIRASVRRIHKISRKRHQDALIIRDDQLVRWLDTVGFDRPTIARAVFARRTGLRRPTTAAAVARTSVGRERELYEEFRGRGLTEQQVQQRIYRRLRGSEAPASAAVRMRQQRYVKRLEALNKRLATPVQTEPLSYALTMLFRTLTEDSAATVKNRAMAVREAFSAVCVAPSSARAERQEFGAVIAGCWGIIPVFPWTTDREVRASVVKLRTLTRQNLANQGRDGTRPIPF